MGKGSARRPGDDEAYRKNWEKIFVSKCPTCGTEGWDYETGYCKVCNGKKI